MDFLKNSIDIKTYKENVKQRIKPPYTSKIAKTNSNSISIEGTKNKSITINEKRLLKN